MKKLLFISLSIFILFSGYNLVIYDYDFYQSEFEKLNVYNTLDKTKVDETANQIITYLEDGTPITTSFLNEKEKIHLKDVKTLNTIIKALWYLSIGLMIISLTILIYKKKYRDIFSSILYAGLPTLFLILLILIISSLDFTGAFTIFHEIFFTNDLWKLNPATDNMIVMFPEQFFYDAFVRMSIISMTLSIIPILAGYFGKKRF